jgi:hypothetical protein
MSRPLPADLREVRWRLARDEGMAAVVVVVTALQQAAGATELRPAVERPAEVAVRVAEPPPLRRVLCCLLIAASGQP